MLSVLRLKFSEGNWRNNPFRVLFALDGAKWSLAMRFFDC
jgi:hypothetical protein